MPALLASPPLLALLVTLGVFKWRAHWAGALALLVSIGIVMAVFHMPLGAPLKAGVYAAVMLVATGFSGISAATVALVANTAAVAFGGAWATRSPSWDR